MGRGSGLNSMRLRLRLRGWEWQERCQVARYKEVLRCPHLREDGCVDGMKLAGEEHGDDVAYVC